MTRFGKFYFLLWTCKLIGVLCGQRGTGRERDKAGAGEEGLGGRAGDKGLGGAGKGLGQWGAATITEGGRGKGEMMGVV